jgi:hypothetical protein
LYVGGEVVEFLDRCRPERRLDSVPVLIDVEPPSG